MKTNYVLVAFIAAAALFFWLASNSSQTWNPFAPKSASSTLSTLSNNGPVVNQPGIRNTTGSNTSGFQGPPPGKPGAGFIGPSGPPPNY